LEKTQTGRWPEEWDAARRATRFPVPPRETRTAENRVSTFLPDEISDASKKFLLNCISTAGFGSVEFCSNLQICFPRFSALALPGTHDDAAPANQLIILPLPLSE